jgi:hypothetical protein
MTVSPPFIFGLWMSLPGKIDSNAAERIRSAGTYSMVLRNLERAGFHGRWTPRPELPTFCGRFEQSAWTLAQASRLFERTKDVRGLLGASP